MSRLVRELETERIEQMAHTALGVLVFTLLSGLWAYLWVN